MPPAFSKTNRKRLTHSFSTARVLTMRVDPVAKTVLAVLASEKVLRNDHPLLTKREVKRIVARLVRRRAVKRYKQYYIITADGKRMLEEMAKQRTLDEYLAPSIPFKLLFDQQQ